MADLILRADAYALPFADAAFDVIVADPPYLTNRTRGKKGYGYSTTGYLKIAGRGWWPEAWRVLAPGGHLYIFCAVLELRDWLAPAFPEPEDVLAWTASNHPAVKSYMKVMGVRPMGWRPIIHWSKEPRSPLVWEDFAMPNYYSTASIQGHMIESEPWPNQLPLALVRWLLRPHPGGRVLDLFGGTGTTRVAALGLGLDVVSVDLSPEAIAINRGRGAQLPMGAR